MLDLEIDDNLSSDSRLSQGHDNPDETEEPVLLVNSNEPIFISRLKELGGSMKIYNFNGQVVLSREIPAEQPVTEINSNSLFNGINLYVIHYSDGTLEKGRLIKLE
jgi:hypothetical protein